ncbi:MAG: phytanoyl-CoA dioxygenase family protein [Pseudomonadota bacterium]
MPAADHRLTTREMATFVANGFLRFDALIPAAINEAIIDELAALAAVKKRYALASLGLPPADSEQEPAAVDHPHSLTPLSACYPPPSLVGELLRLPQVQGIIESLIGADPLFDHDFVHFIPARSERGQHLHVDAVIDNREPSFDVQLFYFPNAVAPGAGGTRFVPGSHLRLTRAEGVARYQHLLGEAQYSGPAGTLLVFHQGLWHAGQPNPSDDERWMYKIRLNPQVPQVLLWNTDDFAALHNDARDHTFAHLRTDSVGQILRQSHRWQQGHELRYEQMERARLWRYLSDDERFDVDYYHTRMEGRARANSGAGAAADAGAAAHPTSDPVA